MSSHHKRSRHWLKLKERWQPMFGASWAVRPDRSQRHWQAGCAEAAPTAYATAPGTTAAGTAPPAGRGHRGRVLWALTTANRVCLAAPRRTPRPTRDLRHTRPARLAMQPRRPQLQSPPRPRHVAGRTTSSVMHDCNHKGGGRDRRKRRRQRRSRRCPPSPTTSMVSGRTAAREK